LVSLSISVPNEDALIPWLDHEYMAQVESLQEPEPTIEEVWQALSKIPGNTSLTISGLSETLADSSVRAFLDTSALAKLYHPDVGSDFVGRLFGRGARPTKVQGRRAPEANTCCRAPSRHYDLAASLIEKYGNTGLRTLDSLQLAVVLDLAQSRLVGSFATADKLLARIAALEALVSGL
jgi:hypothetical protein